MRGCRLRYLYTLSDFANRPTLTATISNLCRVRSPTALPKATASFSVITFSYRYLSICQRQGPSNVRSPSDTTAEDIGTGRIKIYERVKRSRIKRIATRSGMKVKPSLSFKFLDPPRTQRLESPFVYRATSCDSISRMGSSASFNWLIKALVIRFRIPAYSALSAKLINSSKSFSKSKSHGSSSVE